MMTDMVTMPDGAHVVNKYDARDWLAAYGVDEWDAEALARVILEDEEAALEQARGDAAFYKDERDRLEQWQDGFAYDMRGVLSLLYELQDCKLSQKARALADEAVTEMNNWL